MMLIILEATDPLFQPAVADARTNILIVMALLLMAYVILRLMPTRDPQKPKLKPRNQYPRRRKVPLQPGVSLVHTRPLNSIFRLVGRKTTAMATEPEKVAALEKTINEHFAGSSLTCANTFYEDGILHHEIHLVNGEIKYVGSAEDEVPTGDRAESYARVLYEQMIWYLSNSNVRNRNS